MIKSSYSSVWLNKKAYLVHRLIWIWHCGVLPKLIDHIDGDVCNNKIENLRAASHTRNAANRKHKGRYLGISYNKANRKWSARLKNIETIGDLFLGYHKTAEEAARAYDTAAIKYHREFANTNFPRSDYEKG